MYGTASNLGKRLRVILVEDVCREYGGHSSGSGSDKLFVEKSSKNQITEITRTQPDKIARISNTK